MKAQRIVSKLLGEDDVDDFFDRHIDNISVDLIKRNLVDSGFSEKQWAEIDGIETYGMIFSEPTGYPGDVGGWERVDSSGSKPTHYGVSVHVRGGGLYDAGEFTTPEQARQVAALLQKMVKRKVHLIDEI